MKKSALEADLIEKYKELDRSGLKSIEPINTYNSYYKRFKKTYHVLLQLESVVYKGRPIPSGNSIVGAMFMAELKNLLLTAAHDLSKVQLPLKLTVSHENESFTGINGTEQNLSAGDMMVSDAGNIIGSILNGPDYRTRVTDETNQVLFLVYAPPGINKGSIFEHLEEIRSNVLVFSPHAEALFLDVIETRSIKNECKI